MSGMNETLISSLASRLAEALPKRLPSQLQDAGQSIKGVAERVLRDAFTQMNFVTREQFDEQAKLLAQAQQKLTALTEQVAELEKKHSK
jgi:BMFP domain-containing protein YqiC